MAENSVEIATPLDTLADALWTAQHARTAIAQPSTTTNIGLTLDDAYAVQALNLAKRLARGERPIGHKIGLTSRAMQRQLGIDTPDFGVITDAMAIDNGGWVDVGELLSPKIEAEYAFRIGRELPTEPTLDQLREAISDVAVALEIIDSRIADWRISLVDTVADNASAAAIAVGAWKRATPKLMAEIVDSEIELTRDGRFVDSGPGSAVLGDPVVSVLWLATAIGRFGKVFKPGDVILAGAVAASVPLAAGSEWEAQADGFESAVVRASR